MKLRRLDLLAFGPFAGALLDFDGTPGVVDLVYGSNEAGKSTTLRAISGLLFGIPEKSRDAHRHALPDLRVGGILETRAGLTLDVVRRRGRKATLLDREGRALDDGVLAPALGGTTLDLFTTMFGLDHEKLRASAQALLKGRGSVGESLFSAGGGARDIHALRERLTEEAERLFTPRGREQKSVVKAISDVREARKVVEESSTSARAYLEQRRALEEAQKEKASLGQHRAGLLAEQGRLQRLLEVLPHLAQRDRLLSELAALGDVVRLPRDAPERRRAAVRDLETARRALERGSEDVARLESRLSGVDVDESLAALDEALVRDLEDRRGRHVAAELDLPKREGALSVLEAAMKKALAAIDPALGVADIERLRIGASRAARIRKLAADHREMEVAASHDHRDLRAILSKRAQLLSRLGAAVGGVAAESLKDLRVPGPETVERFVRERAALEVERAALGAEQAREAARARAVAKDLDALVRLGDVPTEADLFRARQTRDAVLREIQDDPSSSGGRTQELARAIVAADDLSDRLRREGDRVHQHAALSAELASIDLHGRQLDASRHDLDARSSALERAWRSLFGDAGLSPGSPEEMRPVAASFVQLAELDAERARLEGELAQGAARLARWRTEWAEAVAPLGLGPNASADEAVAVLEATGELLRQADEVERLQRRIEGMQRDSTRFAEDARKLCHAHLPGAEGLPAAEATLRLAEAFRTAKTNAEERRRLRRELGERRAELEGLVERERDANQRLGVLLAEAHVADLVALEDAERRSEAARGFEEELHAVERRLLELGEGATLEDLAAEARGLDADRARARRRELAEEIERASTELEEAVRQVATLEAGVAKLEQAASADAATALAERVARLKREAHRYVRVRLASVILEREIERYRQENQGPLVSRAAELLPRLTLGRYTGLRVGFGADDEAVLLCVRDDGTAVGVEALSDGTCDQLYLALRLASLERYVRANEPLPLVLDDVLIHFDDDRARAALSVLGEVSRSTQVLFFTHHARLLELANGALGPEHLRVHQLPPSG